MLYRIKALKSFNDVKVGDLGGWVESEDNLDTQGNAWVYQEAKVYGNGRVMDGAQIRGRAEVYDNAIVRHFAKMWDNSKAYGNALVDGCATLRKHSVATIKPIYINGLEFNVTICDNFVNVKCYVNTFEHFKNYTIENVMNDYKDDPDYEIVQNFFPKHHDFINHFIDYQLEQIGNPDA